MLAVFLELVEARLVREVHQELAMVAITQMVSQSISIQQVLMSLVKVFTSARNPRKLSWTTERRTGTFLA